MSYMKNNIESIEDALVEIGLEIEAQEYNSRFGSRDKQKVYRLRKKAKGLIAQLKEAGGDIELLTETNEELEYAAQFF